ncbi:MAG: hypothetical protein MJ150_05460, partial [Clostridia bacterium]|nr:hypothetical protein [Clostridia bacterium]
GAHSGSGVLASPLARNNQEPVPQIVLYGKHKMSFFIRKLFWLRIQASPQARFHLEAKICLHFFFKLLYRRPCL